MSGGHKIDNPSLKQFVVRLARVPLAQVPLIGFNLKMGILPTLPTFARLSSAPTLSHTCQSA